MNFHELEIFGKRFAQGLETALHSPGDLNCVRVALLIDGQFDGLLTANTRYGFALLEAAFDAGNVAQVDRPSGNVADDGVPKLVDALELVQCTNKEALVPLFESAARQVDVLSADPGRDLVDADAQLRQLLLVYAHLNFILEATAHLDGRSPFLCLQVSLYAIFGKPTQRFEIFLRGEGAFVFLLTQQADAHDRF